MDKFEVIVFEQHDVYDRIECERNEVVKEILSRYNKYFDPDYITEPSIRFDWGKYYLSYTDNTGRNKPILLMLMGPINEHIISEIKTAIKGMYDSLY